MRRLLEGSAWPVRKGEGKILEGVFRFQTVLLPGNHDQLNFEGGRDLLEPLEFMHAPNAFLRVFREPTLVNGELLFVPHLRSVDRLARVMNAAKKVSLFLRVPDLGGVSKPL